MIPTTFARGVDRFSEVALFATAMAAIGQSKMYPSQEMIMETPEQAREREIQTQRDAALAICWMLQDEPIEEIREILEMLGLLDLTSGFPKTSLPLPLDQGVLKR